MFVCMCMCVCVCACVSESGAESRSRYRLRDSVYQRLALDVAIAATDTVTYLERFR